jgi:DNA polymerase III subunit epsilon
LKQQTKHTFPLKKPLVFFDLETTGLSTTADRIVEIATLVYMPGGTQRSFHSLVNPEMRIAPSAIAVHGITDADVALEPTFAALAPRILELFHGSDLAGYNIKRFDLPLLINEFKRAGIDFSADGRSIIDAQTIFHMKEPRTLSAAVRFYCGREHAGAHSALADIGATAEVLAAQLTRYDDLPKGMEELGALLNQKDPSWADDDGKLVWEGDEILITFGKHRGKSLRFLSREAPDYLAWILGGEFSPSVKSIVRGVIEGNHPLPPRQTPDPA